jgi:hypothetical protein
MDLLGVGGVLFWLGIVMFLGGVRLAWKMLERHGGLDRSRTLQVAFDDDSPMKKPGAGRDRPLFLGGVFLAGFGLINLFTGVTTGTEREQAVCGRSCRQKGYWGGRFAPSATEKVPETGQPQRACWCVGPAGSVELPQQSAPAVSSTPR